MTFHLNNAILLDYLAQKLSPNLAESVEQHLQAPCPACQQQLAALRHLTDLMQTDRSSAPPPNVLAQAVQQFRQERNARPRQRILASLVFDSLRQPSLAAVRGAGTARQFLYSAPGCDIDLHVKSEEQSLSLMGQILGHSGQKQPQPLVCLKQQEQTLDCMATDRRGRFFFKQVAAGNYELFFQFDDMEIAVQDLAL
jgi:hypothetical protein